MLAVIILIPTSRGIKFASGECHVAEQATRIVRFGAGTFLIRYRIIRCSDEILRRTLNAEDGEQPDRNVKTAGIIRVAEVVYSTLLAYIRGDLVAGAAGIARTVTAIGLNDQRTEHDGLDGFNDRDGRVSGVM